MAISVVASLETQSVFSQGGLGTFLSDLEPVSWGKQHRGKYTLKCNTEVKMVQNMNI